MLQTDCESVIIDSSTNTGHKRCEFYKSQCHGITEIGEVQWNLESPSLECPYGFDRFGTKCGCYRIAGTWYGTWQSAQIKCSHYGSNVHLAGNQFIKSQTI